MNMRPRNRNTRTVVSGLLIALFLVVGCGKRADAPKPVQANNPSQPKQFEVVRSAFVSAGYYLPFIVVKHERLLEKRGYTIELTKYQDNTHMVNLFLNGNLDVTAQSSFTMFPTEADHPGIAKFIYGQYAGSYFFMVPSGSPIRALADLRGKTIGTWKSPTAVNYIRILLKSAGMQMEEEGKERGDYKVQRFGATEWPAALENGVVPAVYGFDVLLARLAITGKYRYVAADSIEKMLNGQKVFNGGAFVSAKLIAENPKKARAIREALLEAIKIIQTDPELTARIAAEDLLPAEAPLDERLKIARASHFDTFALPDEALMKSAEQTLQLLVDDGIVPKRLNVRDLFWLQ